MQLHDVEAKAVGAGGRVAVGGGDALDVVTGHLARDGVARTGLEGAGPEDLPASVLDGKRSAGGAVRAGAAAAVEQLQAHLCATGLHEPDDGREGLAVGVRPAAEVFEAGAAFRGDGGRLGKDEAGAANGAAAEVGHVETGGAAVEPVTGEEAGGRAHQAIAESHAFDGERCEELGQRGLGVRGGRVDLL